ncbi:hypothetical protein [Pseudomonas rhodesiae]|uniref:hypothetical protein n=1 Tax=Pseudomonas rhodesiae TaxID=76760 RepID=UPI001F48E3AD|nr:hypothetical protein [Pseudomonas rhodesiae]
MAITLNLQHTFTTRVVYSSNDLSEIRVSLRSGLAANDVVPGKEALVKKALEATDEEMALLLTKAGIRENMRSELASLFGDLNITRMSPVQTQVVS